MKILGIDPGTRHLGYVLVETHNGATHAKVLKRGTIGLKGKIYWTRAIVPLARRLYELVGTVPDLVAIEQINWYGRRKGVLALAHLAGVLGGIYAGAKDVLFFAPKEVKQESALEPRTGWTAHEVDALSLCRLAARKVKSRGKNGQSVVVNPSEST